MLLGSSHNEEEKEALCDDPDNGCEEDYQGRPLSKSAQNANRSKNLLKQKVWCQWSIPQRNTKKICSTECADLGHFTLLICRGNVPRYKTHVHSYCSCLLWRQFGDLFVDVIVVVCLSSLLMTPQWPWAFLNNTSKRNWDIIYDFNLTVSVRVSRFIRASKQTNCSNSEKISSDLTDT